MKKRNGFVSNSSSSSFIINIKDYNEMKKLKSLQNLNEEELLELSFIQKGMKELRYIEDPKERTINDFKNLLLDLNQGYFKPLSKKRFLEHVLSSEDFSDYFERMFKRHEEDYDRNSYFLWDKITSYNSDAIRFFMKKFNIRVSDLIKPNRYYSIKKYLGDQSIRRNIYESINHTDINRNKYTKSIYKPYIKMTDRQFFNEVIVKKFDEQLFDNVWSGYFESILINNEKHLLKETDISRGIIRLLKKCISDILYSFKEIYKEIDSHLNTTKYYIAEYSDGGGEGNTNISIEQCGLLDAYNPLRISHH